MDKVIQEGYNNKMKNSFYRLLCEREEDREWEKYLDSILIELMGIPNEERTINFYVLYYRLSSLRYLSYDYFRKVVFDCMSLVSSIHKKEEKE